MANRRNSRLSGEVRRVISEVIRNEVKDPGIPELLSVTDVHVTEDLKFAKVYISTIGNIDEALRALERAKGFIRKEVGSRIKMRITPELTIEKGIYMSRLINKVIEDEEQRKPEGAQDESSDEWC